MKQKLAASAIAAVMIGAFLLPATAGAVVNYASQIEDLTARVTALEQANAQLRAQVSQMQIPASSGAVDGGQLAQLSARVSSLENAMRQLQETVLGGLQGVIGLLVKIASK